MQEVRSFAGEVSLGQLREGGSRCSIGTDDAMINIDEAPKDGNQGGMPPAETPFLIAGQIEPCAKGETFPDAR